MPTVPKYRVRIFLSVDLTGSTAYKHQNGNSLDWLKAFQLFYKRFPESLIENYRNICGTRAELVENEKNNGLPKLWKTVGDEILFSCRILSQCHLAVTFDAFVKTLSEFGKEIKQFNPNLDTKGNAWVGSFPSPNVSIRAIKAETRDIQDSLTGIYDLPTEENECEVDKDPSLFDFLGKGIDAGFRISKNSAIDKLTISPGLGILLCKAGRNNEATGFETPIWLNELQHFKGVANDKLYPVLTIDTFRDEEHKLLIEKQRKIIGTNSHPTYADLEDYLNQYLTFHKIEIPKIPIQHDGSFKAPDFYAEYCKKWDEEKVQLTKGDKSMNEAAEQSGENSCEVNGYAESSLTSVLENI